MGPKQTHPFYIDELHKLQLVSLCGKSYLLQVLCYLPTYLTRSRDNAVGMYVLYYFFSIKKAYNIQDEEKYTNIVPFKSIMTLLDFGIEKSECLRAQAASRPQKRSSQVLVVN